MTEPQPEEDLELVTFQRGASTSTEGRSMDLRLTIVLIILVLALWALFSPLGFG